MSTNPGSDQQKPEACAPTSMELRLWRKGFRRLPVEDMARRTGMTFGECEQLLEEAANASH